MKLPLPAMSSSYIPRSLASCSPRLRRTLSATTKKPAALAGFLYLILSNIRLAGAFLFRSLSFPLLLSPRLIVQTPNSL